jgi:hypothetical protein
MHGTTRLRRRWFQFSSRSVLALTTLVGLWLGVWANRAHTQRQAVQEIRAVAGEVKYNLQHKDRVPLWLRDKLGDDFFCDVVEATLRHPTVDRTMRALAPDELDRAVAAMRRLPRLRRLEFRSTMICDEDLARLAPLKNQLEELSLNEQRGPFTGAGLKHIQNWPRLRRLDVIAFEFDPQFLTALAAMPNLEILLCDSLATFDLDADAFRAIGRCKCLRLLYLSGCKFDGAAIVALGESKPRSLQTISLLNVSAAPKRRPPGAGTDAPLEFEFQSASYDASESDEYAKQFKVWLDRKLPGVEIFQSYYD